MRVTEYNFNYIISSIQSENKMCLWNKCPNNGKFKIWPRSQGQIHVLWLQYKDLDTKNALVQYESSNFNYDILLWIMLLVFLNVKCQGQKV